MAAKKKVEAESLSSNNSARTKEPDDCSLYMQCLNAAARRGSKQLPCGACLNYIKTQRNRATPYGRARSPWENF
jgi:hypothetical protein